MFYDKDNYLFFKDFSVVATNENSEEFRVIFDNTYQDDNPFNAQNFIINSHDISAYVQNTDIANLNLKNKQVIEVNRVKYTIKNIQYDNNGISILILNTYDDT